MQVRAVLKQEEKRFRLKALEQLDEEVARAVSQIKSEAHERGKASVMLVST